MGLQESSQRRGELPSGRRARGHRASLVQKNQRRFLHERLGAECSEQSGLEVESEEKLGSQDGWAQVRPCGLWEESPERCGQEGQARKTREVCREAREGSRGPS